VAGLALLLLAEYLLPEMEMRVFRRTQRTMLLSMLVLLGITALFRALRDAEPERVSGDRRFRLLGLSAVPVYLLAMYVPFSASFFELVRLDVWQWGLVLACAAAGYGLSFLSDRWQISVGSSAEHPPKEAGFLGSRSSWL
jgi:hypothetical protein